MHEINIAAETITSAADTEANIIFGATINPDLEGEMIVTVVATGFDESYYGKHNLNAIPTTPPSYKHATDDESDDKDDANLTEKTEEPVVPPSIFSSDHASEPEMQDLDMSLDDTSKKEDKDKKDLGDFSGDHDVTHIWRDEASEDTADETKTISGNRDAGSTNNDSTESAEEELEKPSFLRRLTGRRSHKGDDSTEDK